MIHLIKSLKFIQIIKNQCQSIRYKSNNNIGVIGVPFWYGQSKPGVNDGPELLRSYGLIDKLTKCNLDVGNVVDFGNISVEIESDEINKNLHKSCDNNPNLFNLWRITEKTSKFIENLIETGYTPLMIGGDHSLAIGSIMGVERVMNKLNKQFSLIWIDAHADANTIHGSLSGNLHGMPVSFLVKNSVNNQHPQFKNCIDAKNFVYIGLRDVERQELRLLKELNIAYFSMKDVDRLGINEVVARAIELIDPLNKNPIHVSYDVDSMDSTLIQSTGTPVNGGLTLRETLQMAEMISETGRMIALDIVELNPKLLDTNVKQSAEFTIDIILAFFGKSRLGQFHYSMENKDSN